MDECEEKRFAFKSEIALLLDLITKSHCPNNEIFLRELISNGSDALDRIYCKSLSDSDALKNDGNLHIQIIPDKERKTLIIEDSGAGMTMMNLLNKLGGNAVNSGITAFLQALQTGADISTIGQFGVGFFSAYLVADHVIVESKNNTDEQHTWKSSDSKSFTVSSCKGKPIGRGTRITLFLKDPDQLEYLEEHRIKEVLKNYSQLIRYPIKLLVAESSVTRVKSRNPEEITSEEYASLYKSLSSDQDDYLAVKDFSVEEPVSFRAFLFIPLYPYHTNDQKVIRIYAGNVLIMSDRGDLIPEYMHFVRGLVNCEDMPGCETGVEVICQNLVYKCLELIRDLSQDADRYVKFYKQFSKNVKLGITQDPPNREKLADFLMYRSSHSDEETVTLRRYVSRMKGNQTDIYYIAGVPFRAIEDTAFIEKVRHLDFEVLYMKDSDDEDCMRHLGHYDGRRLVSIAGEDLEVPTDDETMKDLQKAELLCKRFQIMADRILKNERKPVCSRVLVSRRLHCSPCCIVPLHKGDKNSPLTTAQALPDSSSCGQASPPTVHFEINLNNSIIRRLCDDYDQCWTTIEFDMICMLLYESAVKCFVRSDGSGPHASQILKTFRIALCERFKLLKTSPATYPHPDGDIWETSILERLVALC